MKARYIASKIATAAKSPIGRIVVLTGARQTGKTTLARHLWRDYPYLSIEDPVASNVLKAMTAAQWRSLYPQAILDEVQREPQLIRSVKSVYDQWPEPKYILLGSSQFLLLKSVKESLAGRCRIMELYPLTLPELMSERESNIAPSLWQRTLLSGHTEEPLPSLTIDPALTKKMEAYETMQRFGGYPALTSPDLSDEERHLWLQDYVKTYLQRDVRDLAQIANLEAFAKMQELLALQTGETFNASEVAKRVGVSSKTAAQYLEYLRLSYQALVLPAWNKNPNKRLVKAPKVHFLDMGVARTITNQTGPLSGNQFESMIVSEIFKQAKQTEVPINLYHLRTHDQREVDLIAEIEQGYYAFEMKQTKHVISNDARHLKALADILDKPLLHSWVVSNDPDTKQLADGITGIHALGLLT